MYSRGERVHIYLSVRRELNKILYKKYCKKERDNTRVIKRHTQKKEYKIYFPRHQTHGNHDM